MNHTVLVVEDERELREMMQDALELSGYAVVAARDGQEALELLDRIEHVCLVLLDLVMPRMNGWDFYAQLRARATFTEVPVVVHSSSLTSPPVGVSHVLQKPIGFEDLMAVVKNYCSPI
jgi:CheY-like chemotaxis protein